MGCNGLLLPSLATSTGFRQYPRLGCSLTKQGNRFLTFLAASDQGQLSSSISLLRKFVASSSKHVSLTTLSHLLSPDTSYLRLSSSLAYPMYSIIKQEPWFQWNAKQVADLIAHLLKEGIGMVDEADELFAEAMSKLGLNEREMCGFYCNLVDSHAKYKSERGVLDACGKLKQLILQSSSVYVKQRGYESMVRGLCQVGLPYEAERVMREDGGVRPSMFVLRSLVYGYGQMGFKEDMKRSIAQINKEGYELDTVCCNMVISSLGAQGDLEEMVYWLRKMRESGIPCSVRTYNSVLNSCQGILSLVQGEGKRLPRSIDKLMTRLKMEREADLVRELLKSSVLDELMEWTSSELRLDMHGMHLTTAYVILLQWFDELKQRFLARNQMVPTNILVICGCGKHSSSRGESPVRGLTKDLMKSMKCPLRLDRKKNGRFTAKGKIIKDWVLLQSTEQGRAGVQVHSVLDHATID